MNAKEALKNVIDIYGKVEGVDDEIISILYQFKIELFNLRIDGSKIKEPNGIEPIAKDMDRNIKRIETNVKGVISENRNLLIESLKILSEYIERNDDQDDNK